MDTEARARKLVTLIATTLAQRPEDVRVESQMYDQEMELTLLVDQEDMGRVIGRQGRVALAVRDLIKASHAETNLHVSLNIDCWQEMGDGLSPSEREEASAS